MSTIVLKGECKVLVAVYLTKSRVRRDLFALFFTNPEKKYYLRELERLLGHSAGNIRRELLKLKNDGLFLTEKAANLVYYYLNIEHPLYEELKNIVFKTIGATGIIKKALSMIPGISTAFIFGSFAAGPENASSDIVLLIIGDSDFNLLNEKLAEIEEFLKREIKPTMYTCKEYSERKREGAGFIRELLERPKTMLIGNEKAL